MHRARSLCPGAGGYLTIDLPDSPAVVIDGYMAFPGLGFSGEAVTREITMEYGGGVTTLVDAGSVAVPGAFAAFAAASEKYGTMPWRYLMEAGAVSVEQGFPMSKTAYTYLLDSGEPIFGHDPASREALFSDGLLRQVGDAVLLADLAPTLRAIGSEGVGLLYGGDLGSAIADDLEGRGGRLTLRDFEAYRAEIRVPSGLSSPVGISTPTRLQPSAGLCWSLPSLPLPVRPIHLTTLFGMRRCVKHSRREPSRWSSPTTERGPRERSCGKPPCGHLQRSALQRSMWTEGP